MVHNGTSRVFTNYFHPMENEDFASIYGTQASLPAIIDGTQASLPAIMVRRHPCLRDYLKADFSLIQARLVV